MLPDTPITKPAQMINNMNRQEIETLYMFLTEEGSELLGRNRDMLRESRKTETDICHP